VISNKLAEYIFGKADLYNLASEQLLRAKLISNTIK
jgi:hypothetical protein